MLAVFTEQGGGTGHAQMGVRAALAITSAASGFESRAGVHTGEIVLGGVGSGDKMEYTALGDAVNVAARLEALNKECGTRVLLSEETRRELGESIQTEAAGSFVLKGKKEAQQVFTVRVTK